MRKFEDYCEEKVIKLYVLQPKSPKMNVYEIPDTANRRREIIKKI